MRKMKVLDLKNEIYFFKIDLFHFSILLLQFLLHLSRKAEGYGPMMP